MKSRWYEYKEKATQLRKKGLSIGAIEKRLKIPRSTLSGWFKSVKLTQKQKDHLNKNWKMGLIKARRKAVLWHNAQKEKRLIEAKNSAKEVLKNINTEDVNILELALAFLYLGEGTKRNVETAIGSSDPKILKFFLTILARVYKIDVSKIRCELGLRADQNIKKIKIFWARELNLPISCFKGVNIDKRTKGIKTYKNYKGVCHLRCGNSAIQRKLIFLSQLFCEEIIKQRA